MDAKQRLLMNQTCSSVINMDRHIKFVCIVDQNGKLLVGQIRNSQSNNVDDKTTYTTKNSVHTTNSKMDDLLEVRLKYKNMHLFYSDYLTWVIKSCKVHLDDGGNKNKCNLPQNTIQDMPYFEISGYSNNNGKLVATPLDGNLRTFLCIYFEPAYGIRNSVNGAKEEFESLLRKTYLVALLTRRC
jgi:hypothetical protein